MTEPIENFTGKIIKGDCLEIMRQMPDKSIDLILTDPPYGIDYSSRWTENHKKIENDKLDAWQKMLPEMFVEFRRILTDTGCCCCCCGGGKTPVTAIFTMEAIKHFNLIQTIVWKKFIGLGWRYRPAYENIVVLSKTADDYNFYDTSKSCSNVIEGINQDIPQEDVHPTQKPTALMERFIKIHSKVGDIVLDPFCGGGSTLVAAKRSGRKYIGIELDKKYIGYAEQKLRNTSHEPSLW